MGIIKVLVHEVDGPAEHPVNVGAAALTLVELRVASKPGAKKPGRKKKSEQPDGEDERDDAPAADDDGAPATMRIPYITSRQPSEYPNCLSSLDLEPAEDNEAHALMVFPMLLYFLRK